MRIALLEDDSAQADLIQSWLTAADYQCKHAASGEAFMKLLCHETFDLLMIDWNLPGISGIDVLQRVRNELDWPIPVLFTTSRISESDIVSALELGADDYTSRGHACGFSNSWNFGFKSVFTCSLKVDFTFTRHSSMAALKWQNVS